MIFRRVSKSGPIFLPFCHNPCVWQADKQTNIETDGRTEFSSLDRVCIPCSAAKRKFGWTRNLCYYCMLYSFYHDTLQTRRLLNYLVMAGWSFNNDDLLLQDRISRFTSARRNLAEVYWRYFCSFQLPWIFINLHNIIIFIFLFLKSQAYNTDKNVHIITTTLWLTRFIFAITFPAVNQFK